MIAICSVGELLLTLIEMRIHKYYTNEVYKQKYFI